MSAASDTIHLTDSYNSAGLIEAMCRGIIHLEQPGWYRNTHAYPKVKPDGGKHQQQTPEQPPVYRAPAWDLCVAAAYNPETDSYDLPGGRCADASTPASAATQEQDTRPPQFRVTASKCRKRQPEPRTGAIPKLVNSKRCRATARGAGGTSRSLSLNRRRN